jgi:alpha-galactosidase
MLVAFSLTTPASADPSPSSAPSDGAGSSASYNGLALTPPMGFNDWYQYRCSVTEDTAIANGQALVSSGLARLGYDYVNLDDCWMASTRAADGQLQADPTRFPHGIAWLADQLHAMGLKLGVYESIGTTTCQRLPGSAGHYQQDADTFASWGVDLLKFDYCGVTSGHDPSADYQQMSQALLNSGRPIVFSGEAPIAAHNADPTNPNYLPLVDLSSKISNMWRVAPDLVTDFNTAVFGHLSEDLPLADYAHPGAWNDLDMLLTGNTSTNYNFKWTVAQQQAQMSVWSEMASPLIVSSDLTAMTPDTLRILGNRDVVAVDQDPLGKQGRLVAQDGSVDVVAKPLVNGDVAVLFANSSTKAQSVTTTATAVGLGAAGSYAVKDLWAGTTRESAGVIPATVPAGGVVMYRVSRQHAAVGRYAPATELSVTPQVPAAYDGSPYDIAAAGQTVTVPAAFTNDGRAPIGLASLTVSAPDGWQVTGRPVARLVLPTGKSLDGTWKVTVPADTPAGTYTVTATARYRWGALRPGKDTAQASFRVAVPPSGTPYLDQLSWLSATSTFHNSIIVDKSYFGGPLTIHGTVYPHGLWANSIADIDYFVGGDCTRFTSDLGIDDSVQGKGSVIYQIFADGQKVYDSGVVTNTTPTVHADVDISGAQILQLHVAEGNGTNQFGNADFGSPQLTCAG